MQNYKNRNNNKKMKIGRGGATIKLLSRSCMISLGEWLLHKKTWFLDKIKRMVQSLAKKRHNLTNLKSVIFQQKSYVFVFLWAWHIYRKRMINITEVTREDRTRHWIRIVPFLKTCYPSWIPFSSSFVLSHKRHGLLIKPFLLIMA